MSLHYDEKGKFFTDYISKDAVRAIIQTATNRIEGKIYVRAGERVSDFLNHGGPFLAVTDVKVFDLAGAQVLTTDFLAVNQDLVVWLAPMDNEPGLDEPAEILP